MDDSDEEEEEKEKEKEKGVKEHKSKSILLFFTGNL